jgi:AcrR family transcriptional regulator
VTTGRYCWSACWRTPSKLEAGVSIGNIYNYYEGKEEIYLSVIQRYELHMEKLRKKSLGSVKDFFDPARIAAYGTRDSGNCLRQPKRRSYGPDV